MVDVRPVVRAGQVIVMMVMMTMMMMMVMIVMMGMIIIDCDIMAEISSSMMNCNLIPPGTTPPPPGHSCKIGF